MKKSVLDLVSSFCKGLTRIIYGTTRVEYSKYMFVDGHVESMAFIPSNFGIQSSASPGYWCNGTFSGDLPMYLYTINFTSECGLIKLSTVEYFDKFNRHKGELVTITYREVHRSIYNMKTNELIKNLEVNYEISDISLK